MGEEEAATSEELQDFANLYHQEVWIIYVGMFSVGASSWRQELSFHWAGFINMGTFT